MKTNVPPPEILEHLSYDPASGVFYWVQTGIAAGTFAHGYVIIQFKRKLYRAHRLAFFFMGRALDEKNAVDHINGNRSDNR